MTTVLLLLALTGAPTMTLDEVLQKNYSARGGLEKLHALASTRVRSHNEGGGAFFETVTTVTRGLKSRSDMTSQGMTESEGTDGIGGWRTNAFGGRKDAIDMSSDELVGALDDADPVGPLVDWKSKGHQVQLVGQEEVDGSPAWKLKCIRNTGTVEYWFLDADSFIEIKVVTQRRIRGALREYETEFGNYAMVDGVYFPFSIESRVRRSQTTNRTSVDAVETNVQVDSSFFDKPGAKARVLPTKGAKR